MSSPDRVALGPELADGGVQVDGRPQHGAVQDQAEGAELVLQAALVPVVQFALLPVADLPGQRVAALLEVADALDVAPVTFVDIDVAEDVQGLEDPPVHRNRLPQRRGVPVALEHGDHVVGADGDGVDRCGDAQDVLPVPADLRGVDPAAGEGVQRAVVGVGLDPPAFLVGQVRERGPVGDAQQLQQAEDYVGIYVDESSGSSFSGVSPPAAEGVAGVGFAEQETEDRRL
jgi:hypothetical protein